MQRWQSIEDLVTRAHGLYFAQAVRWQRIPSQPARSLSGVVTVMHRRYIVLKNTHQTLAVYRIKRRSEQHYSLKRLRSWPRAVAEESRLEQEGGLFWA